MALTQLKPGILEVLANTIWNTFSTNFGINPTFFLSTSNVSFSLVPPQAPHTLQMRAGVKMGDASLQDSMVADGLTDAFHGYHMGITGVHILTACIYNTWASHLNELFIINHPYESLRQLKMWRSSGESAGRSRTGSPCSPRTKRRPHKKQDISTTRLSR